MDTGKLEIKAIIFDDPFTPNPDAAGRPEDADDDNSFSGDFDAESQNSFDVNPIQAGGGPTVFLAVLKQLAVG